MDKLEEELLHFTSGASAKWKSESDLVRHEASPMTENLPKKASSSGIGRSASLSSIKSSNVSDEMRQHIAQLKSDLVKEQNLLKEVKREKVAEIKHMRESESEKFQNKLKTMEVNLRREFEREMEKQRNTSKTEFEHEINRITKRKDNEYHFEKESWLQEKEKLLLKIKNARNDALQELSFEHEQQKIKHENEMFCIQQANLHLQEELKLLKDSVNNRPIENIRINKEHQMEMETLRKQALQDSRKQLSEVKQLQKVIEKLEKKLGFEAGTCLRLQMEKDALDNALARLKSADSFSRQFSKDIKGNDYKGVEFDLEGIIMELPQRLASKPHNDPERIIHRKYIELCSLVRRLDEKNQVMAIKNEEMLEELEALQHDRQPIEEKVVLLGTKNMELSQTCRKNEAKIKELQNYILEKDDKIVHLQQLVEKKDQKLKKARKKDKHQIDIHDYDDLQRQLCQQLQIIAELRQQTIEKDRRIDVLKNRQAGRRSSLQGSRRKSLSLDSLNGIVGLDATDHAAEDFPPEDAEGLLDDLKSSVDNHVENKKRLAKLTKEHLELQQAYALLQRQNFEAKDPERVELHREALQSDLLVSQATINELERKMDDKDTEQDLLLEQINTLKATIDELEEKNEDMHQKLISAESDLVQKTLQLKGMTEEMKELMDENDLMEFRMAELEDSSKVKKHPEGALRLTEDDRENLTTDIEDLNCDAISVRIALKELEINQQSELSPTEKRTLVQARALVDKGAKELLDLKDTEKLLRTRVDELEKKYYDAKQQLSQQDEELRKFRNEKLKLEEHELLNVENISILGKRRKSSFDLTYGFEKSPSNMLAEANAKITELEYLNEMLQNKINRMGGGNVELSDEEIEMLRQKMERLRDVEKQFNILKVSNDDLLHRLRKFEDQQMSPTVLNTFQDSLPKELADEISKLKEENETLNGELGNLRIRADDALALAQKTKEVLSKDDQATQTPSFELFDLISNQSNRALKDPPLEIPELDPEVIEQTVVEEMMTEMVVEDVECLPYELIPDMMERSSVGSESTNSYGGGEPGMFLDGEQLHSDNEFIQSILREYDGNSPPQEEGEHNESVIYRPVEQLTTQPDLSSGNEFDVYLNETLQLETPRNSDGPLSNLSSNRSEHGSSIDRNTVESSNSVRQTQRSNEDHEDGRWSSVNADNEKPLLVEVDGRVSSDCSTCGLTPPCRRTIPQDIVDQLANYARAGSVSSSVQCSNDITPRYDEQVRQGSAASNRSQSSNDTPRADSYRSACSTCGITPPHSARSSSDTRSQSSIVRGGTFNPNEKINKREERNVSLSLVKSPISQIPVRLTSLLAPSDRPSRPVYNKVTPDSEYSYMKLSPREVSEIFSGSQNELRSESASPPYNIPHKPPPYKTNIDQLQSDASRKPLVSNLPAISEDIIRAINNPSEERGSSLDVSEEEESEISLQGVDQDIKELLKYGKHIKEFEQDDIETSEDHINRTESEERSPDMQKQRVRSFSEPVIRYSPITSRILDEIESKTYSEKWDNPTSVSHDIEYNFLRQPKHFESSRQPSKFDGLNMHRLDSGIGSIPRESENDTTYEGKYFTSYIQRIPTDESEITSDTSDNNDRYKCDAKTRNRFDNEYTNLSNSQIIQDEGSCPDFSKLQDHKHFHSFHFKPDTVDNATQLTNLKQVKPKNSTESQNRPNRFQWSPISNTWNDGNNGDIFTDRLKAPNDLSFRKWRVRSSIPTTKSEENQTISRSPPHSNLDTPLSIVPTCKPLYKWNSHKYTETSGIHVKEPATASHMNFPFTEGAIRDSSPSFSTDLINKQDPPPFLSHPYSVNKTSLLEEQRRSSNVVRRGTTDVLKERDIVSYTSNVSKQQHQPLRDVRHTDFPHKLQYGFDECLKTNKISSIGNSRSDSIHGYFQSPSKLKLSPNVETADSAHFTKALPLRPGERFNAKQRINDNVTVNGNTNGTVGCNYGHLGFPRPLSADGGSDIYRRHHTYNFLPTPLQNDASDVLDKSISKYKPTNYFTTFISQENIPGGVSKRNANQDRCDVMLRGRDNLPKTKRTYLPSPTRLTRPIRSRSHSPIRNRQYENTNITSIKSNLEFSRTKFPSDSELSQKSDEDYKITRNIAKSESDNRLYEFSRKLPKPQKESIEPKRISPSIFTHPKWYPRRDLCDNEGHDTTSQAVLKREIMFLKQECESLERQLKNKETVIQEIQEDLKEDTEHILLLERKDKEIQLKVESITQITQLLQKTRKELEIKSVECNRKDVEIKQLKQEFRNVNNEKKKIEHSHSEQQILVTKLDTTETRLDQVTRKYDEVVEENRELIERVKNLEISEREFIDLERNVIDLQTQLRDMEDVEVHRDELLHKLSDVKKQRDDFLEKGKLVEEERNEFVRSTKTLEQYIIEWKKKTTEFKKTNQALKDRIVMLERDKKDLEVRVIEVQQERTSIMTKIHKIEMERDDYIRELREITMERNTLEARLADLEDMLGDHDQLEEGFHSLRLKVSELTRQRDDAEMFVQSYKTKVQLLKKTIVEKEETMMQLNHELETLKISIGNSSLEDISKIKADIVSSSTKRSRHHQQMDRVKNYFHEKEPDLTPIKYYRPSDIDMTSESDSYDVLPARPAKYDTYSDDSYYVDEKYSRKPRPSHKHQSGKKYVAMSDYDPYKSSTSSHPERELRMREGDYVTVYGEMDIDGYMEGEIDGVHGLVPSIYVEEFSDDGRDMSRSHRHHHYSVKDSRDTTERRFVVLYDYDPYTMGTTDRPDVQLSLRKGDVIIVVGDIDSEGYFTAMLNGRRGLVPSNFVEEYSSYFNSSRHHSSSHRDDQGHQNFSGTIEVDHVAGPPYAPRDLKVSRVVTKSAVLLSWQLPAMDEYGLSNGCRIKGYRLWVNGKVKQDVSSVSTTKCLIDDVDLNGRVEFSIQSVGENDICSEKCHFAITGAIAALSKDGGVDSGSSSGGGNMYVALYDYDPFKSSPNPNPSLELAFREGDAMTIYDTSRSDGFYAAEINGKKGLVPSNFIERVSGSGSHHHHRSSHHSSSHHHDSDSNRRVQFQQKKD